MATFHSLFILIVLLSTASAAPVLGPVNNSIETLGIFAALILLIFISAAWSNVKIVGVVGALLLLLLGIWIYTDGIYYYVGDKLTETVLFTYNGTNFTNATVNTTTVYTYNKTNTYEQVNASIISIAGLPSANLGNLIGLVLVLLGMYSLMYYALGIFGYGGSSS
jgi:hypothetical protein